MTIEELKRRIDDQEARLKSAGSGSIVVNNAEGPIGISLVKALYEVVARQQNEIGAMRSRLYEPDRFPPPLRNEP